MIALTSALGVPIAVWLVIKSCQHIDEGIGLLLKTKHEPRFPRPKEPPGPERDCYGFIIDPEPRR